jgi:large subunit ribosomal protein L18e
MKKINKNEQLANLLVSLKKAAIDNKAAVWKRVAKDLEKPTRKRRIVNLYKIQKYAKDDEVVVVPGKVLGEGDFDKKITVAAYTFSDEAFAKINEKGKAILISELVEKNPNGKKVRIMG